MPLHIEPSATPGICHQGDKGHVFTPSRLPTEANPILFLRLVGQLCGEFFDLAPSRLLRHREAGLLEQVGSVHRKRALGVEWDGIQLALHRKSVPHRLKYILVIIVVAKVIERCQPTGLAPYGSLQSSDRNDVKLAA